MPLLSKQLSELVLAGVSGAQADGVIPSFELPEGIHLTRPKRREWGDYSTALPLQLAKLIELSPVAIANHIQDYLPKRGMIAHSTVSEPGFLNVTLSSDWLCSQVARVISEGSSFADIDLYSNQNAQVEFVSANPTGPLTVGHGRGGVLGDTLSNLLGAVGYRVTREFYYNNAGQQMRKLGESLKVRYMQSLGMTVQLLEDHYQGEYLTSLGADLVEHYSDSLLDEGWETFKDLAEEDISAKQHRTLRRLNIVMDVLYNEHSLYEDGSIDKVVNKLRHDKLAYDKDGAVWLAVKELGGSDDRVIVKSTGEPTYRLPDIAYHCNKMERNFDLVIDVLGADHKDAFPDVILGVKAMGYKADRIKMLMHQFVNIKGERMSKRSGNFISLDDLIDEVGADVVRFFMLMRASESHLEFDVDLARDQSDKNPVYYVQYAHARICSILEKASLAGYSFMDAQLGGLVHPSERMLMRNLLELSDTIDRAVREMAPHYLVTYVRDLASSFHAFYGDCRVLDDDDIPLTFARLNLIRAVRIGLARALDLLGVSAPETM
ncbi:MAG: arginine--tRNA ligase [Chloroflexi bacterium]|nr:arginine--tRNA ligase [Chloroflexota bacterium]HCU79580.1 arginine--tRNA ligase [Chloroflexota bacterium]|tara:strand:- start:6970 stop:8613 length:1644 start_codon:yes stop_codon:yes gene_type:complete